MRKTYEKPEIEVSLYLVNEAFASCTYIVNVSPSTESYTSNCSDFTKYENQGSDSRDEDNWVSTASLYIYLDQGVGSSCDCYYTSGTGVGTLLQS